MSRSPCAVIISRRTRPSFVLSAFQPLVIGWLRRWVAAFSSLSIWKAVGNTFLLALMRVPLAVVIGSLLGLSAFAYRSAGKLKDAIPQYERTLADRERVQGQDHRDTLSTRGNLAAAYQLARRLQDAIPQYERAVADSERMLGPGDVETLTTRCNLATAYYSAVRLADMVTVLRRALTDCEIYLGPDHPMTTTVRENLQAATE